MIEAAAGVNVIVLLALGDSGKPAYDANHAAAFAAPAAPLVTKIRR